MEISHQRVRVPHISHVRTTAGSTPKPGSQSRTVKSRYDTAFGEVEFTSDKQSLLWSMYAAILDVFEDANIETKMAYAPLDALVKDLAAGREIKKRLIWKLMKHVANYLPKKEDALAVQAEFGALMDNIGGKPF